MSKKVSIIIPFYNCPYVKEAVESALNQTYQNCEVIVVDDGSVIHSEELLPYMHRISYVRKDNGGTASALNRGIAAASGEYFCWLSSDDKFLPEKVEKQLAFMERTGSAASYTPYFLMNEKSQVISPPVGITFENNLLFYKKLRVGCPINGCSVMLDMKIFEVIGLFDENLPYTQDYDLWLRLIQKYNFDYFPEPYLYYRVHSGMGSIRHSDVIKKEVEAVKQRHATNMRTLIKKEITEMAGKMPNRKK